MRNIFLLILLFIVSNQLLAYNQTPNPDLSPGHLCTIEDPDFKEFRYDEEIAYCRRNVSKYTKNKVCERDGVYDRSRYTVDHIIPLSLGGSNTRMNLWCQHKKIHSGSIEFHYYELVKDGYILRDFAVEKILECKFERNCQI